MPSAALAYKDVYQGHAEALDLDERLWDHIRIATSFVERHQSTATPDRAASAVMVRSPDGEPVVVVLVDRHTFTTPDPAELCRRFNLTPREAEVALLLADRLTPRQVAEQIGVSYNTARCYSERILTKLGIRNRGAIRGRLGIAQ